MKYISISKKAAINVAGSCAVAVALGLAPVGDARAESGFYLGGSVGDATIQAVAPDGDLGDTFKFDESDFAWKAFGGYNFDVAFMDFAIEGGYVDLGAPSGTSPLGSSIGLDVAGWDVFALAGFKLGPVGLFAKAGMISWDADSSFDGMDAGGDSGSDPAYGVGARFTLGGFEIRGEYEMFDISEADDVYMLSLGAAFKF
jgi:hypothetical protein